MQLRTSLGVISLLLLVACAGVTPAPRFGAHSPADPEAAESVMPPPALALSAPPAASEPAPDAAPYTCSMHPEVEQATPGPCPKCGMALHRRTTTRPRS